MRWRAEVEGSYYAIRSDFEISEEKDYRWNVNDRSYNNGNYFRTQKQAEQAVEAIKETLRKFHE